MHESQTAAAIRAWAAERHLPAAHVERWLAMREQDRAALLSTARALRLRTGAMVSALAMLEEIASREGSSIEAVLARGEIARIIAGSGPGPARAKAFLDALKAIRYPRLAETAAALNARIAALGLPRGVSVVLPKDLSSDELTIELRARNGAQLEAMIAALGMRAAELAELLDRLGGKDGL